MLFFHHAVCMAEASGAQKSCAMFKTTYDYLMQLPPLHGVHEAIASVPPRPPPLSVID